MTYIRATAALANSIASSLRNHPRLTEMGWNQFCDTYDVRDLLDFYTNGDMTTYQLDRLTDMVRRRLIERIVL